MQTSVNTRRIRALDFLRGAALSLMVVYHVAYSYRFLFNGKVDIYTPLLPLAVPFVCLFFAISGISSHLSRNNYTRAFKTLLAAVAISFVTHLANPEAFVRFGVIHCLGSCMLLHAMMGKYTDRLFGKGTPFVYAGLFIIVFAITRAVNPIDIPHLYALGFYDMAFSSTDYYGIFPWFFMFLFGSSVADYVVERKLPKWFYALQCAPIEWVGKNALIVYLLHQPVAVAFLYVLVRLFPILVN